MSLDRVGGPGSKQFEHERYSTYDTSMYRLLLVVSNVYTLQATCGDRPPPGRAASADA